MVRPSLHCEGQEKLAVDGHTLYLCLRLIWKCLALFHSTLNINIQINCVTLNLEPCKIRSPGIAKYGPVKNEDVPNSNFGLGGHIAEIFGPVK